MHIVSLEKACYAELQAVGSKAYNLSKMIQHVSHIPTGFVLTSHALHSFLTFNQIEIKAEDSNVIEKKIQSGTFPSVLQKEIVSSYVNIQGAGADVKAVAVRSSSALEDLENASFAGQYETILNVRNREELLTSIKECWASYFSSVVQAYAEDKEISLSNPQMGVLVQGMVEADVSGVIFSVNPITESEDEVVINVAYGLGEGIVSGGVTPDLFIIHKQTKSIVKELGLKEYKLVSGFTGITKAVTTDKEKNEFSISDETALQLLRLTNQVEQYCQYAVDIEFAIKNEHIYLLQVRPVTT
ncbi:PEP/pyruvate-binding domain-containing protein [Priestia megaterium]|uniref:PEP/pyruvate-binding domain-containing protein n=1 Tax=Priestia megaterium TaxID=1404 RepID=UPI0038A49826